MTIASQPAFAASGSAMSKIKAICFDMDGVLVDACEIHRQAFREAVKSVGIKDNFRDVDLEGRPTSIKMNLLGILDNDIRKKINEKKQAITWQKALLYPEDPERCLILECLADEGYKLACVTNSVQTTADGFLTQSGLYFYLDLLVTNENVMLPKPDPSPYRLAMERLGVTAAETLIVEDSPIGLESARRSRAHVLETTFDTFSYEAIKNRIQEVES